MLKVIRPGPAVSGVYPAPGSVIGAISPKFSIRFNDPAQLDPNVSVTVDGQNVSASVKWDDIYQQVQDSCTGEWYDEYVGPDYTNGVVTAQFPQLTVGEHTVAYMLKDTAGNITESSYSFTILDTEGPQISQQTPADGAAAATSKPAISAKISDSNTVVASSVYMFFNGSQVNAYYDGISAILTYNVRQPLKNGTYPVQVTASDNFGNTTVSSWSFNVSDNNPPAITSLTPANGSQTGATTPEIAASISDGSGIINPVYLQVDGDNFNIDYSEQTGKASYTPTAPLGMGQHTVNMVVYDFQGNRGSASWVFSIDTSGPVITELSPEPGTKVVSYTPQFRFRFNDPHKLDPNVTLKIDGQSVTPTIKWDDLYQQVEDSCTGEWYDEYVGPDYTRVWLQPRSHRQSVNNILFIIK